MVKVGDYPKGHHMELHEALTTLKKQEKRKFDESIDVIFTLKGIDLKRDNISTIVTLPHPYKQKTVCGFLTKKSDLIPSIVQTDFQLYKDAKKAKKLVKQYDFFVAHAKLMPAIATTFGRVLGPTGKMPSPQLGVLMSEEDAALKALLGRINSAVRIKVKEACIKVCAGKVSMKDDALEANIRALYEGIVAVLPVKRDNVKRILVKTTMGAPMEVAIK